jgi:hypothetical protein
MTFCSWQRKGAVGRHYYFDSLWRAMQEKHNIHEKNEVCINAKQQENNIYSVRSLVGSL